MPLLVLAGETLAALNDGYLGKIIDENMRGIMKDIDQRGHDGAKRVLNVKVTFIPMENGQVKIDSEVNHKLPVHKPPQTIGRYDHKVGGVTFRDDSPADPDQSTINDVK
jgi:hypothetical protein